MDSFSKIVAKRALLGPYSLQEQQKDTRITYGKLIEGPVHFVTVDKIILEEWDGRIVAWYEIMRNFCYVYRKNADRTARLLAQKYRDKKDVRVIYNCVIIKDTDVGYV